MHKVKMNIIIFSIIVCCNGINVFAATGPGTTMVTQETTKGNWGVKIVPAEYYDPVEYDDQGRLVDKNRIIIGKGEGGVGQGGGFSEHDIYESEEPADNSWGVKIVPAEYYDYVEYDDQGRLVDENSIIIGQGGGLSGQCGNETESAGKNVIGNFGNQSSNNVLRKQQAADEASRQASIEAEIATAGMRQHEIQESIQKRLIQESLEKESSKQKSMKTSTKNVKQEKNVFDSKRGPIIDIERVTEETTMPESLTMQKMEVDDRTEEEKIRESKYEEALKIISEPELESIETERIKHMEDVIKKAEEIKKNGNADLRKQQAEEESLRQASIEAKIVTTDMRQQEIQESEEVEKKNVKQYSNIFVNIKNFFDGIFRGLFHK